MEKFKVGDRVVIVDGAFEGDTGVVAAVDNMVGVVHDQESEEKHTLSGRCANHHGWWHIPRAVKLADEKKPKRTIVMEITDDGATAKYLVGKKVEKKSAVKRYFYDKPSDKAAAYYAVCKLFGGDLSEVVEKLTVAVASADKARDLLVDLIKGN